MKHIFLSSLFTSLGLPGLIFNYLMCGTLALRCQVTHP